MKGSQIMQIQIKSQNDKTSESFKSRQFTPDETVKLELNFAAHEFSLTIGNSSQECGLLDYDDTISFIQ